MEVVSKPCKDWFLHPILVHYRINRKIQVAKWGAPKKYFKIKLISCYKRMKYGFITYRQRKVWIAGQSKVHHSNWLDISLHTNFFSWNLIKKKMKHIDRKKVKVRAAKKEKVFFPHNIWIFCQFGLRPKETCLKRAAVWILMIQVSSNLWIFYVFWEF